MKDQRDLKVTLVLILDREPKQQRLTIRVFDKDTFKSDDALGYTLLPIADVMDGSTHDFEVELFGDGGGGQLLLSVTYSPFTGETKAV